MDAIGILSIFVGLLALKAAGDRAFQFFETLALHGGKIGE